jgi:hypothetical protein
MVNSNPIFQTNTFLAYFLSLIFQQPSPDTELPACLLLSGKCSCTVQHTQASSNGIQTTADTHHTKASSFL